MRNFDVVILGGGSGAEAALAPLVAAGLSVAIVEGNRVGGECAYVACMPSKALLRAAGVRAVLRGARELGAVASAPQLEGSAADYAVAVGRRDRVAAERDDTETAAGLTREGATIIRGWGRVVRPGVLTVDARQTVAADTVGGEPAGEEIGYTDLVVDTGSDPIRPPIEGLDDVPTWSSDQALSSPELPRSLIVLGGSAVGCELAQIYAAFGVRVVIVEVAPRLIAKEEPAVANLLAEALREDDGIDLRIGVKAVRAEPLAAGGVRLHLEDGSTLEAERLLIAAGRRPTVARIGLEALGISPNDAGALAVTEHCRVVGEEHVWACGDVTGIAPYTHTANYQGAVLADNLAGRTRVADYRAIPRAVYTDPAVASVGLSGAAAREAGIDVVSASFDLTELPRAAAEGTRRGLLVLQGDRRARTLVGMSAVGPNVDDLVGEAALAIQARVPLEVFAAVIHPFPSFGQAFEPPLRELVDQLGPGGSPEGR
ncbi:MAG: NAD(P)/FAD-dependent oxidoreductase [Candidatus Dormibacteria bacterium]